MFVFSLSPKKIQKKFIIIFSLVIFFWVMLVIFVFILKRQNTTVKYDGGSYNTKAESIEDIRNFALQFGWKIKSQPEEVTNILIPSYFNDIYEHYNAIQKEMGLDLSGYRGKECCKYSFKVLNYPDNDDVNLNIIVFDGRVIGGDLSENIMDGFMKKFT
ncbi:MAG: DUF4830 domain-containing protein [Clostridia bacterium]|nr:DUF4830 domain-containing protein [Clostridia bacterium]